MTLASTSTSRWAISTRTNGEVLTAGIARSELELVVLGVPSGFNPPEIESWLHDLAGVAVETSRADGRPRAMPALMHHALTGLLFSHAELWDQLDAPRPCSSAYVDLPEGAAFGWVGEARVHVLVDGDPFEPHWVRVRDEAGREARAAVFAPGSDVVVSLEYWPQGEDSGTAPASLEAEWISSVGAPVTSEAGALEGSSSSDVDIEPTPEEPVEREPAASDSDVAEWTGDNAVPLAEVVRAESFAPEPFREPFPELPETLPTQQPGLSAHGDATPIEHESLAKEPPADSWVTPIRYFEPQEAGSLPVRDFEPLSAPEGPTVRRSSPANAEQRPRTVRRFDPAPAPSTRAPQQPHPIARWLSRIMRWGKPASPEPQLSTPPAESAPVSAYDALLSRSVPPPSEHASFEPRDSERAADASRAKTSTTPHAASTPSASAPAPTRGPFRRAGRSDILGSGAKSSTPPAAVPPPLNDRLQALLREIEAAEAGQLPVISPDVPPLPGDAQLHIDHEPVGADESFGIPPLPSSAARAATPGDEERGAGIPKLASRPAPTAPSHPEPGGSPPRRALVSIPVPIAPPVLPSRPPAPPANVVPPVLRIPSAPPAAGASSPAVAPDAPAAGAPVAWPSPRIKPTAPGSHSTPRMPTEPIAPTAPAEPAAMARTSADVEAPPMLRVSLPSPAAHRPDAAASEPDFEPFVQPLTPTGLTPTRRAWPLETGEANEKEAPPWFRRPVVWIAGIVGVFIIGWLLGGFGGTGRNQPSPIARALGTIGIGGAHFTANINSSPGGAHIDIDGKPQDSRTPATLDLPPGAHTVTLSLPGLGSAAFPLTGKSGEKVTLDESLNGSLEILDTDSSVPISVSIDGRPAGYAPMKVEVMAPGLHEVQFNGPGMPAWAQSVQVGVRTPAQLIARPMTAPANGIIQAQATLNDEEGAAALNGAQVYVDGELRGVTPVSVELPRGPHSLRVIWRGETAPIQVIDLPGGNQRFATFNFGLDVASAKVTLLGAVRTFSAGQANLVSASLDGLQPNDVREAWLHARGPEGLWRRYPMTLLHGNEAPIAVSPFPEAAFDAKGTTRWYVSVTTPQGDEYFSEIQQSALLAPAGAAPARPRN